MKKSFGIFSILLFFIFINSTACSKQQNNKLDSDEVKMLRNFYTLYITQRSSKEEDWEKIEIIKSKYCTEHFLRKIKNEELDADPFVDVQDFNKDWLKTLSVNKDMKDKTYKVCFIITYNNNLHCLNVSVKKENDIWKIDNVSR